ncbi:hypothetical protein DPMN_016602 [Dreissena polymorpha]|uniref:Uncharacterized protein n=1 Tax=Dreissena polymorpha TaxID=45954 RepID=A0A9D4S4Q7_DREPO|nr:hypothetical protein DPMN_016602 [Dreissena polymorpha]
MRMFTCALEYSSCIYKDGNSCIFINHFHKFSSQSVLVQSSIGGDIQVAFMMGNAIQPMLKLKFPDFHKLNIIHRDELHPIIHHYSHLTFTNLTHVPFSNRHITVADHIVLLV